MDEFDKFEYKPVREYKTNKFLYVFELNGILSLYISSTTCAISSFDNFSLFDNPESTPLKKNYIQNIYIIT